VESPLRMRVDRVGDDTMVSAIVRLLDRAQAEKPRLARLADRVAGWFVAGLLAVATGVALWWGLHEPDRAFAVTLSVLVVTCPCALSLATPAAVAAAVGALTRLGLLITRGHTLETLARATVVVFDKTGTLTLGMLRLTGTRLFAEFDEARALALAAALERSSEHPVAKVLVAAAGERLAASAVEATPGYGIEGVVEGRRYRVGAPDFAAALAGAVPPEVETGGATVVVLADEARVLAAFE
ncbi:MAG: HAD-IC family P-type ATPase, partial [Gammaproteobacteria bacterium]